MRTVDEIVLPQTKPETEWIGDRPVQKVMPTRKHSLLQAAFLDAIKDHTVLAMGRLTGTYQR